MGRRRRHAPGPLRAGAQPRPDDARRHQHLGAARAGLDRGRRHRPRPARRRAPRRGAAAVQARAPGWPRPCSPTGTTTTPRARARFAELHRAPGAGPGPGAARRRGPGRRRRLGPAASSCACVATPGHTSDSLSFALPADAALLTGDTVLGRGTTVVAHPDGELADYLDSLRAAPRAHRRRLGRAHPARARPGAARCRGDASTYYLAHRAERLDQVRDGARRRRGVRRTRREVVRGASTPTCRQRCGRRPSCRSARSSSTCRAEAGCRAAGQRAGCRAAAVSGRDA